MIPETFKENARKLRKNMTKAEILIWCKIKDKNLGVKFHRQKVLYLYTENNGSKRYIIPDFYCIEKKLIIEIDGKIHNLPEIMKIDNVKEELIKQKGLNIIRIKNEDIYNNLDNIIIKIKNTISSLPL